MKLRPVSLRTIKALEFNWQVSQRFARLNGTEITIYGYGSSRHAALQNFDQERWSEEVLKPFQPFDDLCGFLWDAAGLLDKLTKITKRIKRG